MAIADMARVEESTRSQRILVVDQDPALIDTLVRSFRYEGFEVDEALNGQMAVAAAYKNPPDVVVLDVMLPDLDGLEVTRRLRTDGSRAPILFVTGRETGRARTAGLSIGDACIAKPFAISAMTARVHAILSSDWQ